MAKLSRKEMSSIIEQELELPEEALKPESQIGDVEEWDSVGHPGILVALDKALGGKVGGLQELATADSIEKIWQILSDHGLAGDES